MLVTLKNASLESPSLATWLGAFGAKSQARPRTLVSKATITVRFEISPGAALARRTVPLKPVAWQKAR